MAANGVQYHPGESAASEFLAPERIDTIAQALADETRRQLLKFLVETGSPLSASRAARALYLETKRLNYRFKVLAEAQLVVLSDTQAVRGFTEKLFMASSIALENAIVRAVLDVTELWPALSLLASP